MSLLRRETTPPARIENWKLGIKNNHLTLVGMKVDGPHTSSFTAYIIRLDATEHHEAETTAGKFQLGTPDPTFTV